MFEINEAEFQYEYDLEELALSAEDMLGVADVQPQWFLPDEDPAKSLLRYMRDIDNIQFTARHLFNFNLLHSQVPIVKALFHHKLSIFLASRGIGKTTLLGFYALYYAVFYPGCKIVVTGAGFRQARMIVEGIHTIVGNSPVLKAMFGQNLRLSQGNDKYVYYVGESTITAIPMGDGSTVRGLRAQVVIVDEFASVNREVYEVVIKGFGVVNQNPDQEIKARARITVLKRKGLWTPELEAEERKSHRGNQQIIAATASWQFNHFYKYYMDYKSIIESGGDPDSFKRLGVEPDTNPRDYCIIRLPWKAAPPGHYDETIIQSAKNTNTELNFNMEFETIFPADSNGFFPRSIIEYCTTHDPISPYECSEEVKFHPLRKGNVGFHYVFGVDPAHSDDSLAVVVVEVHPTHRRVVHVWTINKDSFRERQRSSGDELANYYAFCARKIRNLMKIFPTNLIAMDAQGGGAALMEAFGDPTKLEEGEEPILPIVEGHMLHPGKVHPDEDKIGLHIVELVQFRDYAYTQEANTKLRKDMEDRAILFPYYDQVGVAIEDAGYELFQPSRFDTYEDLNHEIEELKNELTTIVIRPTPTGMDHWDVPEIKGEGRRKGRMRKDRYSALIMANYAARRMTRIVEQGVTPSFGMAVLEGYRMEGHDVPKIKIVNPQWWTQGGDHLNYLGCV